ncbi:hypothetical protein GCM10011297_32060 [Bacterioplanes sanyensis]|uniref:hypothetical protein n=1 Tax=Bacterioplanes sanyensis TaxID=1249553 RepID=UPI00167763DE|nr:hypothetical protein [Bacterioplanes sanyensis]GGY56917.1 hypothetical protein GCM10011297_32060 [Bacterioplanes sanyensis]
MRMILPFLLLVGILIMRRLLIILLLACLQGCGTFHVGDLHQYDHGTGLFEIDRNIPVIVEFYTNYGSEDDFETQASRDTVFDTVKKHFPNQTVIDRKEVDKLPDDYLQVYVVQDFAHDGRQGDLLELRNPLILISALTFTIIPGMDFNIDHYVNISRIKEQEKLVDKTYAQSSRRYFSVWLIPFAPFYTIDDSLAGTLSSSIQEYLRNEG